VAEDRVGRRDRPLNTYGVEEAVGAPRVGCGSQCFLTAISSPVAVCCAVRTWRSGERGARHKLRGGGVLLPHGLRTAAADTALHTPPLAPRTQRVALSSLYAQACRKAVPTRLPTFTGRLRACLTVHRFGASGAELVPAVLLLCGKVLQAHTSHHTADLCRRSSTLTRAAAPRGIGSIA
jgi:hypothetical protein